MKIDLDSTSAHSRLLYIADGLTQDWGNPVADTLEFPQYYAKPSISHIVYTLYMYYTESMIY